MGSIYSAFGAKELGYGESTPTASNKDFGRENYT
jgi:hypothetical protein